MENPIKTGKHNKTIEYVWIQSLISLYLISGILIFNIPLIFGISL